MGNDMLGHIQAQNPYISAATRRDISSPRNQGFAHIL
jgi:hypothetical protein